jgi:hypothetical protein
MDAPYSNRLARIVVLGLALLLAIGLWEGYGAWALDAVIAHGA